MGPTTGDIEELAERLYGELVGTCDTMPDWVDEHEQEAEIKEAFDQLAFQCTTCGWWCDQGEASGELNGEDECSDCYEG